MIATSWVAHIRGEFTVPVAGSIVLFVGLIVLSAIDFQKGLLPDWLTFPLIGLGLVQNWVTGNEMWPFILGGAVGYLVLYLLSQAWVRFRGELGMGLGDAKLLAASGTWLGMLMLPMVLLIASVTGLIYVFFLRVVSRAPLKSRSAIPFGPFLALGIWTMWCNTFMILK